MTLRTVATALGILAIGAVVAAIALGSGSEGDSTTSVEGSDPKPRYCPKGKESGYDATDLIGRNAPTARRVANDNGCEYRVVRRDGKWLAHNDDLRWDRINLGLREHRVVRIHGIY